MRVKLRINGTERDFQGDGETPLLWVLRDELNLTGTKYGCGQAQCGACTVHMNGKPIRSCITPVNAITDQSITTIEEQNSPTISAVRDAWINAQVAQCGYCQPGQVMSAAALLSATPKPTDAQINAAMSGNICRCATYARIRAAIHAAAEDLGGQA
ncbi:MAG: (2Fe-2S)-binding protein [Pseudomonadota bacterium]